MSDKQLKLTALGASELARLLTASGSRNVSEQDVLDIAEIGGLLSEENTINLVEFTAFLAKEVAGGSD
jgi:hypothetical protein